MIIGVEKNWLTKDTFVIRFLKFRKLYPAFEWVFTVDVIQMKFGEKPVKPEFIKREKKALIMPKGFRLTKKIMKETREEYPGLESVTNEFVIKALAYERNSIGKLTKHE